MNRALVAIEMELLAEVRALDRVLERVTNEANSAKKRWLEFVENNKKHEESKDGR